MFPEFPITNHNQAPFAAPRTLGSFLDPTSSIILNAVYVGSMYFTPYQYHTTKKKQTYCIVSILFYNHVKPICRSDLCEATNPFLSQQRMIANRGSESDWKLGSAPRLSRQGHAVLVLNQQVLAKHNLNTHQAPFFCIGESYSSHVPSKLHDPDYFVLWIQQATRTPNTRMRRHAVPSVGKLRPKSKSGGSCGSGSLVDLQ